MVASEFTYLENSLGLYPEVREISRMVNLIFQLLFWLNLLEQNGVTIMNNIETIRWNSHKKYLLDLESKDISIVPSVLLEKGSDMSTIEELMKKKSWEFAILKPAGNRSEIYSPSWQFWK
jgi:hypothetical protein